MCLQTIGLDTIIDQIGPFLLQSNRPLARGIGHLQLFTPQLDNSLGFKPPNLLETP